MGIKVGLMTSIMLIVVGVFDLHAQDTPPALDHTTSWIGNSFGGAEHQWVQNYIDTIHVQPDGTVYGIGSWDEAGGEVTIYANGKVEGRFDGLHGWGRGDASAALAYDQYVYVAMSQGGCDGGDTGLNDNGLANYPPCPEGEFPPDPYWYSIRRYTLDGQPAPFPLGYGYDGSIMIVSEMDRVSGLAAYDDKLYVSDTAANRILEYDLLTFGTPPTQEWSVPAPNELAFGSDGTLFVLSAPADGAPAVLRFAADGTPVGTPLTFPAEVVPTGLAVDGQQRLLIADNGVAQQIRIYAATGDAFNLVETFGEEGGVAAVGGLLAPLRFNELTGVGVDEAGILYISESSQNTALSAYRMNGERLWHVYSNEFVDSAVFDPLSDGMSVYTDETRYAMDYSQPGGIVGTAEAFTLNRFSVPTDPRTEDQQTPFAMRWLDGQKFLYTTDMYASSPTIYRFSGETAIPASILFIYGDEEDEIVALNDGLWLWRDLNGDGARTTEEHIALGTQEEGWGVDVDNLGGLWFTAVDIDELLYFPYGGLDEHGNPIYDPAAMVRYPIPFAGYWQRVVYDADSDTMYIGGYIDTETDDCWGLIGKRLMRFDGWLSGERTLRWDLELPYTCGSGADSEILPKAMSIAGDYLFTVDVYTATVRVYDLATAAPVGTMSPGAPVGNISGWIDIPYALHAVQRASGDYVLLVEEDAYGKIIVYNWDGVAP